MKRRTFLAFSALLALSACTGNAQAASNLVSSSASTTDSEAPAASDVSSAAASSGKSLVIYFSATGNTEKVAQEIAAQTGAEVFQIVPEQPYMADDLNYNNNTCRANQEQEDDSARPAIVGSIENFEDYDTVYLGFPIWWGTVPRIIDTLLDTYDFGGKTVWPFCTSGSSGISTAVSALKSAEPDAEVKDGLRLSGAAAANCADEVKNWLGNNQ